MKRQKKRAIRSTKANRTLALKTLKGLVQWAIPTMNFVATLVKFLDHC